MRFYLDEQIDVAIASQSRAHGLDVVSARDMDMLSKPDREHLEVAAADGRFLVTGDLRDFQTLSRQFALEDLPHAGVLLVPGPLREASIGQFILALQNYAERYPEGVTPYTVDFLQRPR
jgi:predicted nuclease of predicted toxin-antitoxin system